MTGASREIPEATVARLPVYRRSLIELDADGIETVSSVRLAELAGVNAAKVRKDLSYIGSYGTRGVGYDVSYLAFQIDRVLGNSVDSAVVIVGAGNLGRALARYGGFTDGGFPVVALMDNAADKIGEVLDGLEVKDLDLLPALTEELGLSVGIIAVPPTGAQPVADRLVAAGITAILNFAPTVLSVPDDVQVRYVDLATELQILTFFQGGARASVGPLG